MAIKLRDIATKLNISPSLVSGVLNDRANVWASAETRERIHRTARELGYRPHAAARALRSGKTEKVALVYINPVDTASIPYGQVTEVLAVSLGAHGYQLLVSVVPTLERSLTTLRDMYHTRVCDAFILWGVEQEVAVQGELMQQLGAPFVVKGHHEGEHPDWLQIDYHHEDMMAAAVAYLSGLGHHRIAYMGYPFQHIFCQRLVEGYRGAMRALLEAELPSDYVFEACSSVPAAEAQMMRWLAMPEADRPTALVCGANRWAWHGVEKALAGSGRRLGWEQDDFCMVGNIEPGDQLLFGEAMTFQEVGLPQLAQEMTTRLLLPLLTEQPREASVVRLNPELAPTQSMHLPHPTSRADGSRSRGL
jgi:LacI family transcriptional regulator